MKSYFKRDTKLFLVVTVIIMVGLYFRTQDFYHNVDGSHIFRQTMMTSNIYYFVKDGLALTTKLFIKNQTHKIFDFPIYQYLVTGVMTLSNLEIVQAGRALNIVIYVLTMLVLYRFMVLVDLERRLILIVLFLFSLSPLSIFYSRAIIPDNLPVLLGFLSFSYFFKWDFQQSYKVYHYTGMLITGILATLIKNPIYLPIVIAIISYFVFHGRWKQLFSPAMIAFLTTILITVVCFRLYSNYVNNGHPFQAASWEQYWYFSNIHDRMTPSYYIALMKQYFRDVVPPPFLFFCVVGIFIYQKNHNHPSRFIFWGLLIGSIITILVFFNLMRRHNYYFIPYVFITCFFTGYCIDWCYKLLKERIVRSEVLGRFKPKNKEMVCQQIIPGSLLVFFILLTFLLSHRFTITKVEQVWRINAGTFINQNTPPDSLIVYVVFNDAGWDPSYLYYARREGYHIAIDGLTTTFLEKKLNEFGASGFYLFVPRIFPIANEDVFQEFKRTLVAESSHGLLFKFENNFSG